MWQTADAEGPEYVFYIHTTSSDTLSPTRIRPHDGASRQVV